MAEEGDAMMDEEKGEKKEVDEAVQAISMAALYPMMGI